MKVDFAVVGAGIAGLSVARALHRHGKSVVVLERLPKAEGASVRNFGMIWPLGHPVGEARDLALRSREIWLEASHEAGFGVAACGSLTLAYEPLEARVLEEFLDSIGRDESIGRLIGPDEVKTLSPNVRLTGLLCALLSPTEVRVDPREVVHALARHLTAQGVDIRFGFSVGAVEPGRVTSVDGSVVSARKIVVCAGPDVRDLLPGVPTQDGLRRCRLQMLRLRASREPAPLMGPHLCAGLTLGHYANFKDCPSLKALRDFHAEKWPEQTAKGIHVLVAQHFDGTLTIGDSHEYGESPSVYRSEATDTAILAALDEFLDWRDFHIAERWDGYYNTSRGKFYAWREAAENVYSLNLFGTGMTLSFGVAERIAQALAAELG